MDRKPHSRRWVVRAAVITGALLVLVASGVALITAPPRATISASSTAVGFDAEGLLDGNGSAPVWRSAAETRGAELTVHWARPAEVSRVRVGGVRGKDAIRSGHLVFSDGSTLMISVGASGSLDLSFPARTVRTASLVVDTVTSGSAAVQLAGLRFDTGGPTVESSRGDLATAARITASTTGGGSAAALRAGTTPASTAWRSAAGDARPIVRLRWDRPQQVTSIQIFGSGTASGRVAAGSIAFGDGSTLPLSGVLAGAAPPTTIAFMPRVVSAITVRLDSEGVGLRRIAVWPSGVTPSLAGTTSGPESSLQPSAAASCSRDSVTGSPLSGRLRLACPGVGSTVDGDFAAAFAAPAGARLTASAFVPVGADGQGAIQQVATGTADARGRALIQVDARALMHGPMAIRVTADGVEKPVYLQLVNRSGTDLREASAQRPGQTLVFDDEFDGPVSASSYGAHTTYTATKPLPSGPSEFGDGVFAQPSTDPENIATSGTGALRLRASPLPAGRTDPRGYGRKYLGALLSSASVGGGGFSAQYGTFEARILGAPGPGTWPAFWTISTSGLYGTGYRFAEIDAVELYGHDTSWMCTTPHNWVGTKDVDGKAICQHPPGLEDWALTWHTYAAKVEPNGVTFLLDGRVVARTARPVLADEPLYFLINLELGGGWPIDLSATGDTADMYVDWIRVYT